MTYPGDGNVESPPSFVERFYQIVKIVTVGAFGTIKYVEQFRTSCCYLTGRFCRGQLVLKEYDLRSDPVRQRLSRDLFIGTVDALVEGAPHITGSEWDALILVRVVNRATAPDALKGSQGITDMKASLRLKRRGFQSLLKRVKRDHVAYVIESLVSNGQTGHPCWRFY